MPHKDSYVCLMHHQEDCSEASCVERENAPYEEIATIRAEVEKARAEVGRLAVELRDLRLSHEGNMNTMLLIEEQRDAAIFRHDELKKEAIFRIALSDLWVVQLRGVLSEAIDTLARDPKHDVSLLERLKSTWAAIDGCEVKPYDGPHLSIPMCATCNDSHFGACDT